MTVWLVLDHHAQREWTNAFSLLRYSELVHLTDELHDDLIDMHSH